MTYEQAKFVRKLRIDDEGTYRYIANEYIDKYNLDFVENLQEYGINLCDEACRLLNESYEDGWS